MGYFKIRQNLAVAGGSVLIGADTGLYRDTTDRLKTDDALEVAGTAQITGAARVSGILTLGSALAAGGSVTLSGTPFVIPYGTAAPTFAVNGDLRIAHVTHVPSMRIRSGGTTYTIGLPSATHGTVTITVG